MTLGEKTQELQKIMIKNTDLNTISEHDIISTYQDFIDCLTDHNHLYYIDHAPIISDIEYDELFAYLKKIEEYFPHIISSSSPTQELVGQISEGFEHAKHKVKLLSLENSYNAEDLYKREEKNKKIMEKIGISTEELSYYIEPKFDGISVELIYKYGKLFKAITRGDGTIGDDITENAKMIYSIPKELNSSLRKKLGIKELSLRGEIMMPKAQREILNQQRIGKGQDSFANTRNATAGSIKLLNSNEVKKRGLVCFVYDLIYSNSEKQLGTTHQEIMQNIKTLGAPIFKRTEYCDNIDTAIKFCSEETKAMLNSEQYDFDGLVIKINELSIRKILGETAHHPRRQIAYKFPAEQISTQINSVDFQVGRTGIITPVANLEPVQLSGVTISRVSLHNFDFIKDKDIKIHDYIWLQRSGEVIPYITSVIKDRRDSAITKNIEAPKICPSCSSPITKIDMHYYCTNNSCPAQIKEKLIHFASKNCMDIEGIGNSIIDILVDQNIVKNFADLYKIMDANIKLKIQGIPGFGSKKLFEISQQLETSKTKPLRRLLNALGIPGVGKKIAQEIVKALTEQSTEIKNFEELKKHLSDIEFLENIHGIGEKIITGITHYLKINKNILEELNKIGLNFAIDNSKKQAGQHNTKYRDKHFAITGSFPTTRDQIIEQLESQGAIFDSQPNKTTDFILIGEKAGSKKTKAEELKIKIYEKRENITNQFPELSRIVVNKENKKNNTGPVAQSLF